MNDLFVDGRPRPRHRPRPDRGKRHGRPRARRPPLEWATAPDNRTAQRLYDSTGAERSDGSSTSYTLKVAEVLLGLVELLHS